MPGAPVKMHLLTGWIEAPVPTGKPRLNPRTLGPFELLNPRTLGVGIFLAFLALVGGI